MDSYLERGDGQTGRLLPKPRFAQHASLLHCLRKEFRARFLICPLFRPLILLLEVCRHLVKGGWHDKYDKKRDGREKGGEKRKKTIISGSTARIHHRLNATYRVLPALYLRLRHRTLLDADRLVEREHAGVLRNEAVCLWQRRLRIVLLIVALAAIADHVHHNVTSKGLTPFCGVIEGQTHGLWIVGVGVKDGRAHNFCHIRRVP